MSVITWPSPDMAKSGAIMFKEWVSVSFDFRVLGKVLWKPANALVAANECLKSLGLKFLVQTRNVFVVASLKGSLSKSVHRPLMP